MMSRHGRSRYTNGGCRCDICRAAAAAYQRKWRRRVRGKVPVEVPHGLASTQQNYGCPCPSCRAAAAEVRRRTYDGGGS
jgi:hypothetical protein